jgi:hypothetical protein
MSYTSEWASLNSLKVKSADQELEQEFDLARIVQLQENKSGGKQLEQLRRSPAACTRTQYGNNSMVTSYK